MAIYEIWIVGAASSRDHAMIAIQRLRLEGTNLGRVYERK